MNGNERNFDYYKNSLKILMGQLITGLKADDCNCNYGHPKMADVESGKNLFCRSNCFYNVF